MPFRPAEPSDVELLFWWRRDDEQAAWYEGRPTTLADHRNWFTANRDRIRVWEANGVPVGAVRVESDGTVHFTIDYLHRPQAVPMIKAILGERDSHGGRLKALLDDADEFRTSVFREAGFVEFPAKALIYKP